MKNLNPPIQTEAHSIVSSPQSSFGPSPIPKSRLRTTCPICRHVRREHGCYAFFVQQALNYETQPGQSAQPGQLFQPVQSKEYCLQPQDLTQACLECQTPPGEYHHFRCPQIRCPLPTCGKLLLDCHWSQFYAEIRLNGLIYNLTIIEQYDSFGKRRLLPEIKLEKKN